MSRSHGVRGKRCGEVTKQQSRTLDNYSALVIHQCEECQQRICHLRFRVEGRMPIFDVKLARLILRPDCLLIKQW